MKPENKIALFDVVALTSDLPHPGLVRGQVGTAVELLGENVVEIEFSNQSGEPYATAAIPEAYLMVLHYHPASEVAAWPFNAAKSLEFEEAARLRDQIAKLEAEYLAVE